MDTLRRAFRDIKVGHTRATIAGRAAFIRHLSYEDQVHFDEKRAHFYEEAKAAGLPTEAERVVQLKEAGQWSDEKELAITRARQNVEALREGTAKARRTMPSAVKDYLRKIQEAEREHQKLELEKRRLLGITCEISAAEEVNDFYIATNLFADVALAKPLFAAHEFEYLTDAQVTEIVRDYQAAMEGCSDLAIRKLALQPWFQRYFQLCGDDLTGLFRKAIADLTFAQVDLLRYGAHFRHIYASHDVSKWKKEILEDPDLLTEYASSIDSKKKELEAQGAHEEGTIVVGANREDAKVLGVKAGNPIAEITKRFGGNVVDWAAQQRR